MMLDDIELKELHNLTVSRLAQPWGIKRGDDNANFDRMARLSKSAVCQIRILNGRIKNIHNDKSHLAQRLDATHYNLLLAKQTVQQCQQLIDGLCRIIVGSYQPEEEFDEK